MTQQSIPKHAHIFEHRSQFDGVTVQALMDFHADAAALKMLTPPPIFVQMKRDERTSLTDGDLYFTLWMGPIPVRWHAQHQPGPTAASFADEMIDGPLAYWRHVHRFDATPDGAELTDMVTLAHRPGWRGVLTRLIYDGLPLRILFIYRHFRTRLALRRQAKAVQS